jgi:hypothetical protein
VRGGRGDSYCIETTDGFSASGGLDGGSVRIEGFGYAGADHPGMPLGHPDHPAARPR